jgi:hypothetical protein
MESPGLVASRLILDLGLTFAGSKNSWSLLRSATVVASKSDEKFYGSNPLKSFESAACGLLIYVESG